MNLSDYYYYVNDSVPVINDLGVVSNITEYLATPYQVASLAVRSDMLQILQEIRLYAVLLFAVIFMVFLLSIVWFNRRV